MQYRVEAVDGRRPARAGRTCSAAASTGALAVRRARGDPHPQGQGESSTTSVRAPLTIEVAPRRPTTPRARAHPVDATPRCPSAVRSSTPLGSRPVGVGLTERRVLRTHQWIERGGARLEPLAADAFAPALEAQRIMREGTDVRRDDPGGGTTASGPTAAPRPPRPHPQSARRHPSRLRPAPRGADAADAGRSRLRRRAGTGRRDAAGCRRVRRPATATRADRAPATRRRRARRRPAPQPRNRRGGADGGTGADGAPGAGRRRRRRRRRRRSTTTTPGLDATTPTPRPTAA